MPILKVDHRERGSGVPEALRRMGVTVLFTQLKVGDYVSRSNRVGVERKSSGDFINSIFDGRLFDQARRLKEAFSNPVVVVEGGLDEAAAMVHNPQIVWGAVGSLVAKYGLSVVSTPSYMETAMLLKSIATKDEEMFEGVEVVRAKPRIYTPRQAQLYVLQGFPGIGPKMAEKLLSHFGNLYRVFHAKPAELEAVLGRGRARKFLSILNYTPSGTLKNLYENGKH